MLTSFRKHRPQIVAAFMLIEVLVATALLAVGVTASLRAIFNSLQATIETRLYTKAVFMAQTKMTEFELQAGFSDNYDIPRSGVFEDEPNFRWQARVDDIDEFWTRRIAVSVIWAVDEDDLYDPEKNFYYRVVTEVPRPRYPEDYEK